MLSVVERRCQNLRARERARPLSPRPRGPREGEGFTRLCRRPEVENSSSRFANIRCLTSSDAI